MRYISQQFQYGFREFCVEFLSLKQIDSCFTSVGIKAGSISNDLVISGDRRRRLEEYYISIDWESFNDCQKVLDVVTLVLAQSYLNDERKKPLKDLCVQEGLIVDTNGVFFGGKGVDGQFKNLIFAANGPKPKIVLIDATNNDIEIRENAEYCLVYDRPLERGLLWDDLIDWWKEKSNGVFSERIEYERELYKRLILSLQGNKPEQILFKSYFEEFRNLLQDKLPALIPQVYLHYDPYTITFLQNSKDLVRQRMDFLLLFSNRDRVVIEIDGKHHYSENGNSNPKLYAEMMEEDRRLKLSGYEVYRFGGYEFSEENIQSKIRKFFEGIFRLKGFSLE